jgi:hypothetical protein
MVLLYRMKIGSSVVWLARIVGVKNRVNGKGEVIAVTRDHKPEYGCTFRVAHRLRPD